MSQLTQQTNNKRLCLPPYFKTSFIITNEFTKLLKQKSFVCWNIINNIQIRLNNSNNKPVYETILQNSSNELEQLMIIAWEKIHCGKWDKIDLIWRDLYALSCYGYAAILFLKNDLQKSIHTLDLGIIMGHKTYQSPLQTFVQYVHDKLTNNLLQSNHKNFQFPVLKFIDSTSNTNIEEKKNEQSVKYLNCVIDTPIIDKNNIIPTCDAQHIDLIQFITDYFNKQQPVLIKNMASNWPAIEKWKNLQYFMNSAGFRTVPVEIGKVYTDENWTQKLMPFHEFISKYLLRLSNQNENDNKETDTESEIETGYLAQHLLFEQIKCFNSDFNIPDFVHIGEKDFYKNGEINCWFGPRNTITPIHYDPKHNILAQMVGYKYLRLYSPKESENLYPRNGILNNTSQIDPQQNDEILKKEFPKYFDATCFDVVLEPGDALYMPPKWWHYVKSLSISFSVSFWFE